MAITNKVVAEARRLVVHFENGNITDNDLVVAFFRMIREEDEQVIATSFQQLPEQVHAMLHTYLLEFRDDDYRDNNPFYRDGRNLEEREIYYKKMKPHFILVTTRLLELSR